MEIVNIKGNILDSSTDLIAHQVNNKNAMGSGVAKAISDKWPDVKYKYHLFFSEKEINKDDRDILGTVLPVMVSKNPIKVVLNMFSQDGYGNDGKKYTSYDALDICLKKIRKYCISNDYKSIAFPYKMSSDRGGADWNVVVELIKSAFKDSDIRIEIWNLN